RRPRRQAAPARCAGRRAVADVQADLHVVRLSMFQVRIHGRGGQGVLSAAEMLSVAAFEEGRYAQAFPSFGSERMGAPVAAYCRIDGAPIRLREPVLEPDLVVVQDVTLLHALDLFEGLRPEGHILFNTTRTV